MLEVTQLNQCYGGSHILWDVNLSVPPSACTCLMGRNGMGETTLLKCIMRLLPVASGELIHDGQQQQLAIGCALVFEPRLLILDEPSEGIQPNVVQEIGDILLKLNREAGLTVLLVERKPRFARRVASEFRILDKGRLVAEGGRG
ncbi:MAG: ATP-binding cassette domain-containing protein [Pseudomonadota bacterium]|nr:ATP-binding cassette domain-containing protein [Pseudomonadota bacterium]